MTKPTLAMLSILCSISTSFAADQSTPNTFDYKNQPIAFWATHLNGETLQLCRFSATEKAGTGKYDHF